MLCDYKGHVKVKIASVAASAASVIAMAGEKVQMSPTALLMIHDPMTFAMGNARDMEKAISTLTEKEQIVIHKRFEEGLSLDEVGEIFGLTRERIRQIEAKAVRKLRHPSRLQYIKYGVEGKKLDDDLRRREKEIIERERKLAVKEEQLADALNTLSLIKDAYTAVEEPKAPETNLCDKMKIESLGLTVRSYNCLKRANINTIGDLAKCAESGGLNHIRNLGRISVKEILTKLFAFGYDYYDVYENPKYAS